MGLFDALRRLFFGGGPRPQAPPPRAAAAATPPRPQAPAPQTNWPAPAPAPAARATPPAPAQAAPQQRRDVTLDLDAGAFQPLSADQVKAQAAGQTFTGFFEFGRQSRIPSAIDPRTKLIDQGMVGQGLIAPEELVRIHALGERMDDLRPERAGAHVVAERAVQADKAERARIKAEKKAAAELRRREHAARVAHHRQTDIVYLGRGVSAGLADRRSNVEKLQAQGLPVLSTPADVAVALGLSVPRLRWLAYHAEATTRTHYVQFLVPKKSGGERTLCAPHQQLAAAQGWVLDNILRKLPAHDAAHGFVPGRSIVTNAAPHVGSAVVINCDLRDFFPSVTVRRVIGLFKHIGYSPAVATVLALLVTESPRKRVVFRATTWHVAAGPRALPQGACTSPDISNLVARRLDARLAGLARKLGWTYTRYADDLTFSSKQPAADKIGYVLARLRHVTADEGFETNEPKTRVLKRAARQTVTGVVTNEKPSAPRRLRRRLRAILHNAQRTGLAAQNRRREPHFPAWLAGTVEFVAMVNAEQGAKLKDRLRNVRA